MVNEEGEVEDVLDCNSMGLFGLTETRESTTPPTPLRLEGSVWWVPISGASHNFISPGFATALGLPIEKGRSLGVKLGDGHRIFTGGKCNKMEVMLEDFTTTVDAFVLKLGDLDMILGVAWLQRFGKVTFDWEAMMRPTQADSLLSILLEGEIASDNYHKLTQQQQELGKEHVGLPPKREVSHAIKLRKDTAPVSVRLYR
jgi:hypothetical protein